MHRQRQPLLCTAPLAGVLLLSLAGCGAEASLTLQFAVMDGDDPLAGLATLEVTVFRDDTIQETQQAGPMGRVLRAGGSCCVTMCFCSKDRYDTPDGCNCGDAACRDACSP